MANYRPTWLRLLNLALQKLFLTRLRLSKVSPLVSRPDSRTIWMLKTMTLGRRNVLLSSTCFSKALRVALLYQTKKLKNKLTQSCLRVTIPLPLVAVSSCPWWVSIKISKIKLFKNSTRYSAIQIVLVLSRTHLRWNISKGVSWRHLGCTHQCQSSLVI